MSNNEITPNNEIPNLNARLQKEVDNLRAKNLKLEKRIYAIEKRELKTNNENLKLQKKIAAMEQENEKSSAFWSKMLKDIGEAAQAERSKERTPPISEKPPFSDQGV